MLKQKNAIITGASSGIGYAIVKQMAENGANIWACVHAVDSELITRYSDLEKRCHVWIKPIQFDLLNEDSVIHAIKEILNEKLQIDVLVNCAGVVEARTLGMTTLDELKESMMVNFYMPSIIMKTVSRKMIRQKKGNIINIISKAATEYRAGAYAYGSSKMALLWGTRAAAKELSVYNIRVNGIAPGLTDTKLGTKRMEEDAIEKYVSVNNIKRPAIPEEIASTVLFLASDLSTYISGQIINCDGGRY